MSKSKKTYWYCDWNKPQSGGLRSKDDGQMTFYARMAQLAYKNEADRIAGLKNHGFVLDKDLSNDDVFVAHNPDTKEVVHGITGSRFGSKKHKWRDIRSDLGIVAGVDRMGKRTKEVESVVKKSMKKYGKTYNYTNTGHSLGGRVSSNVSKKLGIDHVGFNSGTSPLGAVTDKISKIFGRDKKATRQDYTTGTDILSKSGQLLGDNKVDVVQGKSKDKTGVVAKHEIENFTQDGKGGLGSGVHKKTVAKNTWLTHVDQVRRKNKSLSYKECLKLASKSYTKK